MADQIERIVSALTESLLQKSKAGGTQKLTILDNKAVGSDQAVRSCLIYLPPENTGKMYITTANEDADINDFRLPIGQVIPFPVDNLSDLHFCSTVNGDIIHISWRN